MAAFPSRSPLVLLAAFLAASLAAGCAATWSSYSRAGIRLDAEQRREEIRPLAIEPGDTLTLCSPASSFGGDVRVLASTDGAAQVHATIVGRGRDDQEAARVLTRFALDVSRGADGPEVRVKGEPLRIEEGSEYADVGVDVDYVVRLPPGTALRAATDSGDVVVEGGLGACDLRTSFGAISVRGTRGELTAESGSGDVTVADVEGPRARLISSRGVVSLRGARVDEVEARSGSGNVEAVDCTARTMSLATTHGDVYAAGARGDVTARSGGGDVRVEGAHGAVDAATTFGDVRIDGVLLGLSAESNSGEVVVDARPGSRLEGGPGWRLDSTFGRVSLGVPADFGCRLEARTTFGRVASELPVLIEAGAGTDRRALVGQVGGGGPAVTLSSTGGDVRLRMLVR